MHADVSRALSLRVQGSVYKSYYISGLNWGCLRAVYVVHWTDECAGFRGCPGQVWEHWSVVCATLDGVYVQGVSVRWKGVLTRI